MWSMQKFINRMVQLTLRSPLHGMMGSSILLITCCGRKSGKEYTLPVQYVQDDQTLTIVVGEAEKKTWWRNLRGGASVQVVLAGERLSGRAEVWEGERDAARIAQALSPYLQRFPTVAKKHAIRQKADGSFNADDLGREAHSTVMVRLYLES